MLELVYVYFFVCVSVCVCVYVYIYIYIYTHTHIYLSIYLYVSMCPPSLCIYIYPSIYVSIYLSGWLYFSLSLSLSLSAHICLFISLSIHLSIYLWINLSNYPFIINNSFIHWFQGATVTHDIWIYMHDIQQINPDFQLVYGSIVQSPDPIGKHSTLGITSKARDWSIENRKISVISCLVFGNASESEIQTSGLNRRYISVLDKFGRMPYCRISHIRIINVRITHFLTYQYLIDSLGTKAESWICKSPLML